MQLRFYRDAAGELLPRLDCFLPTTPDHGITTALEPGEHGAWRATATITDASGKEILDAEFSGTLVTGQETFTSPCKVVLLYRKSMTAARRTNATLDCQVYRLPPGIPAEAVTLRSPLATTVPAPLARGNPHPPAAVTATLSVPEGVPADLLVGAYCTTYHGDWFQTPPRPLGPGTTELRFPLTGAAAVIGEPAGRDWTPVSAEQAWEAGLYFASSHESRLRIGIEAIALEQAPSGFADTGSLRDLELDPPDIATGERWECRFRPDPLPANPYVPELFAADLEVTGPDGKALRYPAFYRQPVRLRDIGDGERAIPDGAGHFCARYRPRLPGTYRLRLLARWATGEKRAWELPELLVSGAPWDDYVRVDSRDPRFFSTGRLTGEERFYWPVTLNLRSVYDVRGQQRLATRLTPDRGLLAYSAYVDRLAAAGGSFAEIWMASWNLALEWNRDWPGYGGIGVYNQGNAHRVDALLDHAWSRGVRLLLVINNHGQASARSDREWSSNPWNAWNGGPLDRAGDFFRDPEALAGQHRLRRYLVGRYGDHPAVFGWKVFSEINLTALSAEDRVPWHRGAADDFHRLDHYDHPVTSHWAGTYKNPYPEVCALKEMDFIAIDAYHRDQTLLPELLALSTGDPARGLGRFGKPLVTTEYGGSARAAPPPRLLADHLTGHFSAFVSGHATGPMLWWFEWVDQGNRWKPLAAAKAFIEGEDLRGDPGVVPARVLATPRNAWCGVWRGKDRLLVYAVDSDWGITGGPVKPIEGADLELEKPAPAGRYRVEWWDPDEGRILDTTLIYRPQGLKAIELPPFRRHLAAKLIRLGK